MHNSDFKNINQICVEINNNNSYMIIGFGDSHQFKSVIILDKIIKNICNEIPINSFLLYFGDKVNIKSLDIGYVFNKISNLRKDLKIIMIQINEFKQNELPNFVYKKYYHSDYSNKNKYGGLNSKNEPVSNTKKWVQLHTILKKKYKNGITKSFFLGGGGLSKNEIELCIKYKIPINYYYISRKYKGDKKTLIKNNDSIDNKYGPTIQLINKIHKSKINTIINYYPNINFNNILKTKNIKLKKHNLNTKTKKNKYI